MLSRYHRAMLDDAERDAPAFDPPDADAVREEYLETCRRMGVKPVPRERALGLIGEWTEVLSGRPEPTQH
jgi:hypothetical protein